MKNESYKTREERLRYLIRAMQKEMPQYRGIVIPEDSAGQKQLLRSLMKMCIRDRDCTMEEMIEGCVPMMAGANSGMSEEEEIGRASCRERV